jgi:hypothetical protein
LLSILSAILDITSFLAGMGFFFIMIQCPLKDKC